VGGNCGGVLVAARLALSRYVGQEAWRAPRNVTAQPQLRPLYQDYSPVSTIRQVSPAVCPRTSLVRAPVHRQRRPPGEAAGRHLDEPDHHSRTRSRFGSDDAFRAQRSGPEQTRHSGFQGFPASGDAQCAHTDRGSRVCPPCSGCLPGISGRHDPLCGCLQQGVVPGRSDVRRAS
jgi:hypothetical protein